MKKEITITGGNGQEVRVPFDDETQTDLQALAAELQRYASYVPRILTIAEYYRDEAERMSTILTAMDARQKVFVRHGDDQLIQQVIEFKAGLRAPQG